VAEHGWAATLEFTPNSAVTSLGDALDVVGRAVRPNAKIVFDTWHFFRGTPDYAVLDAAPGELIGYVQLNDAAAEPSGPLVEDTKHRKLPGGGELDLEKALRHLDAIGGLRSVGPEVYRPHDSAQSCAEAIREMQAATEATLTRARISARASLAAAKTSP
jgi:sugar phosphate isomerase/epimerase